MCNKEEILYNCKSLTYAWFSNINQDAIDLNIELSGDLDSILIPTTLDNCSNVMCELLYNNCNKYNKLRVLDNKNKTIGEIDIK